MDAGDDEKTTTRSPEESSVRDRSTVGDALDAIDAANSATPTGVQKWLDLLAPVVESGLVDQLVEFNVDGRTDPDDLAASVPEEFESYVERLL